MSNARNSIDGVKILGGMNYSFKEEEKEQSVLEAVDAHQEIVTITVDELVDKVNESIEGLDDVFYEQFTTNPRILEIVRSLREEEYGKLPPKKRAQLFAKLNSLASQLFAGAVDSHIYLSETPIDGKTIVINDNGVYFYKTLFSTKDGGLSVLHLYIYSLKKHVATVLVDGIFDFNIDPEKLKGTTRIYYDNLSRSILRNSWRNRLEEHEKNFTYQPIVYDALSISREIMFELTKFLYKEYKVIDKGMSHILYDHMDFMKKQPRSIKKRNEMVAKQNKNIKLFDKELALYEEYLKATTGDLSTYSDDEFYELFNTSYYDGLNVDEDGLLVKRLNNMVNELIKRPFREFDISQVEFPLYEITYNEEENIMTMKRTYKEEVDELVIQTSSDAFSYVLADISIVAQKNKMFKFNNEQEKQDYMDMVLWCDMKNHDYSDPTDKELVRDGLNIILQKVSELFSSIQKKSQAAIDKSRFTPHAKTMLLYQDKESYYDYHEFKNCHTKQEIHEALMDYIRLDIEDMKKKGGR